ncbi:MAG: S9 family peptidase [Planctomycetota bacterium]|nr:S9 family peptidase [Planctomycetota bacterium]
MMKQAHSIVLALGVFGASTLTLAAGEPLSLENMTLLHSVGSPNLSPDGLTIALSVSAFDAATQSMKSGIELIDVASGERRDLVQGSSPQWSSDGRRLAYTGSHDGQRGLWVIDVARGDKTFITSINRTDHFLGHRSRKNWSWSPDGKWIAYIGAEPDVNEDSGSDVQVFTRTLYKTRTGFSDNRNVHVWVASTDGQGEATCLTPGDYDEHSLSWSPDSKTIAFSSNRSDEPDHNYRDDIYTIDIASGKVTQVTDSPGTETSLQFSPDGEWIAFHGSVRPVNTKDSQAEDTQLFLVPSKGGDIRNLTSSLDRRVGGYLWHPSGSSIYFTAGDHGKRPIFRVNVESASIDRLIDGPFTVGGLSFDASGQTLAVNASGPALPSEIWITDAEVSQYRKLTSYQDDFIEAVELQEPETFWFESFDGTSVQGWVMKPVGYEPGTTYPTILTIHGGPHGMYSYGFSSRTQWLAAHGYGVIYINPRGSSGYGQTFSDGCVLNWGGGDYQDLMLGVDHAQATHDWIDEDRLGVMGGSYGGYMTNWVVTQTDRFKAAITVASVSNLISFYGTSLYQLLVETEFNGLPWDNYDLLWHWSPLKHVKNVVTPTLLIHGAVDHDVPIGQAEEFFIALRKLGVDTEFVRYPNEGHGFRQPQHRIDYMNRQIDWFDRYLK